MQLQVQLGSANSLQGAWPR